MLFFDPQLTIDGNVSGATCHQSALYGTDALARSIGIRQRLHPRHAPTILNAAIQFVIHWRGDRINLEDQAFQAQTSPITGGYADQQGVADRVIEISGYRFSKRRANSTTRRPRQRPSRVVAGWRQYSFHIWQCGKWITLLVRHERNRE